jgi:hypothetical protein
MEAVMVCRKILFPTPVAMQAGVGDFVELRTPWAIAVQNEVKAQNKKAFVVVFAISSRIFALTLEATVQYSGFSS